MIKNQKKTTTTPSNYLEVHEWVNHNYGRAKKCEGKNCSKRSKTFVWAKKRNRKYEKNIENFKQLCVICHLEYDGISKRKKNSGKYIFVTYRITPEHDKIVKKHAKKISESEVVRKAITSLLNKK